MGLVYIDQERGIGFSKKERPWKTTKGQVMKGGRSAKTTFTFSWELLPMGFRGRLVRGKTVILMESSRRVLASWEVSAGVELTFWKK
ncbi:hypothetical protein OIU74_000550 [Salix koriyanagi]|uniref:Uncharacterized protein n=1 Tax=Salix koriyanagi TaxID=2511006 RepID=A0A9Q0X0C5_9ROSI|nr:hypothetical protein OIU74_000550 [Salix koriyanagi]